MLVFDKDMLRLHGSQFYNTQFPLPLSEPKINEKKIESKRTE